MSYYLTDWLDKVFWNGLSLRTSVNKYQNFIDHYRVIVLTMDKVLRARYYYENLSLSFALHAAKNQMQIHYCTYSFNISMSSSVVPHEKVPLSITIASADRIKPMHMRQYLL